MASGFGQPARRGERQQFVVGPRIPEEEGKTRSQFKIRQCNFGIGRSAPATQLHEWTDRGTRDCQHRRHDLLDSQIEAAVVFSAEFIERHEAIHIFRGHRTAEGPARQILGNLPRACGFARHSLEAAPSGLALRGCFGIADKDQGAARSSRNTGRVIRPDDFDAVAKTRHAVGAGAEPESADTAESGGDILVGLDVGTVDKGHNHVAHAGCQPAPGFS